MPGSNLVPCHTSQQSPQPSPYASSLASCSNSCQRAKRHQNGFEFSSTRSPSSKKSLPLKRKGTLLFCRGRCFLRRWWDSSCKRSRYFAPSFGWRRYIQLLPGQLHASLLHFSVRSKLQKQCLFCTPAFLLLRQ